MTSEVERTLPWSLSDARTTFLATVLGTVVLGWAWWEASGTGTLNEQTTAVVFAVLAAVVVVAGGLTWLAAGRRAVGERRLELVDALEQVGVLAPIDASETFDTSEVIGLQDSTRYHRHDCLLVRGKDAKALTDARALAGRTPCEMCRP